MRTYTIEVAEASEYVQGVSMSVWRVIATADFIYDARELQAAAEQTYPGKRVRIREQRPRADIDG